MVASFLWLVDGYRTFLLFYSLCLPVTLFFALLVPLRLSSVENTLIPGDPKFSTGKNLAVVFTRQMICSFLSATVDAQLCCGDCVEVLKVVVLLLTPASGMHTKPLKEKYQFDGKEGRLKAF